MESELSGYVTLTLSFEQEGSEWVGTCLELGTSTFADTLEECQVELEELVTDHLDVLEEVCERERFFEEWGIEDTAVPRRLTEHDAIRFRGDRVGVAPGYWPGSHELR